MQVEVKSVIFEILGIFVADRHKTINKLPEINENKNHAPTIDIVRKAIENLERIAFSLMKHQNQWSSKIPTPVILT